MHRTILSSLVLLAALACARADEPVAPPAPEAAPVEPAPSPAPPPPPAPALEMPGRGPGNGYQATGFTAEPVHGQSTRLGQLEQRLSFGVPVWRCDGDAVMLNVKLGQDYFSGSAVLPERPRAFPRDLYDIGLGAMYSHRFDNGWVAGGRVGVESPSDQPFSTWNETSVSFNGFLRMPAWNQRDAWMFSLNYSPSGELPFPLPGVAYLWQPSDDLHITIGLPFAVMVRPIERLRLDFTYVPVRNVHARATWQLAEAWEAFAAFDWNSESWFLADRPDHKDRFQEYDKRLGLGLQAHLARHLVLGATAGYVFDRFFFEGQNYSDRTGRSIEVGNGAFGELRLQFHF